MIIMMPVNEDKKTVCISYGRAPFFMVYDSETKERNFVVNEAADAAGGAGIKAAQLIIDNGAEVILTPRCGENAVEVLDEAGIRLYKTTTNDIDLELEKFAKGELNILTDVHQGIHHK